MTFYKKIVTVYYVTTRYVNDNTTKDETQNENILL